MKMRAGMMAVALLLAACGQAPQGEAEQTDAATGPAQAAGGAGHTPAIAVSIPQIAYTYGYDYAVPDGGIARLQARHVALCDRLGPAGCHVVELRRQTEDGTGSLTLAVRAGAARAFGRALSAEAARGGGGEVDSSIAAEDLSKQIVDTEARLRSRQALADRLMELLRTRNGPVADLVAAERSVADVQEEIDAARSWLATARARVAMATFELRYDSNGGSGFLAPLRSSLATMATFLGRSLALLVQLIAVTLPWLLLGGAILLAVRWWRRRRRRPADDD